MFFLLKGDSFPVFIIRSNYLPNGTCDV